jgi:ABC-type antimicrobial peptide transport system permease subunit
MWLVIKRGMSLAVYGVCLGALGALALTRLLSTLLYKVSVTDPFVFGSIAALLLGVALLASYLPAYRATKVDPVVALRSE